MLRYLLIYYRISFAKLCNIFKNFRDIPDELKRMSQHDVLYIAEFIKRLDNSNQDGDR